MTMLATFWAVEGLVALLGLVVWYREAGTQASG